MEWTQLLNQAIDYLEEHLTGEISGTEAASHVGLSAFHFQRAFSPDDGTHSFRIPAQPQAFPSWAGPAAGCKGAGHGAQIRL